MRRPSRSARPTKDPFIPLIIGAGLLLMLAIVLIVFVPGRSAPPGPSGVSTLAPNTPGPSPTAEPQAAIQYRPSAAGWIAYIKDGDIWLVHPDGSSAKQVTRDRAGAGPINKMAWSTDGLLLAYSQGSTLSVLEVAGLGNRVLTENLGANFSWSATAHQVVYDTASGSNGANDGLWVVSADDGKTLQVAKSSQDHPLMSAPVWSFDSNSLIFSEPGGPRLLALSTGDITPLVAGGGKGAACSWSPVEMLIACVDGDPPAGKTPSLYLLNENGIAKQRFDLPAGHLHARLGPWSDDGGSLAVIYSTEAGDVQTDLFSLDSGEFKTAGKGAATSWSPDGRWVAMDGNSAQPITVVNTTSALSSTLDDGASPLWQPSASEAVIMATAAPVGQSFCMDTSVGFVHKKPLGHYLIFCIGSQKYNYGALAAGVYLVGPQTRYFIYVSNSGYVFAARMGASALTRLGNVRWMRAISIYEDQLDPDFQIRPITGYPYQFKVYEQRFNQHADFTMPRWIVNP